MIRHKDAVEQCASTGVEGLDSILGGGLPRNHLYLVEGKPGCGKTTLALQFLLQGKQTGEKGLYVTLSESKSELVVVADSHGWSLDGIELYELEDIHERFLAEDQYTVFHPADVELNETMKRICDLIDRIEPSRVVFDSLSEMRLMARDPLRYRRQILALKHYFANRQCTVLLLDDQSGSDNGSHLQSISHGVIQMERVAVEYGGARRRVQVAKMRGLQFQEGLHDFVIYPGGLTVFPRLVAARARRSGSFSPRDCVQSGVPELDRLLGGGLHRGTSALIIGPAGCGKSSMVTQYGVAAAERGERVAYYIFEETRANFLERSISMGLDLKPFLESGQVSIHQIDPAEMSPGEFAHLVRSAVEREGASLIVIDSLNGYLNAMPSESFLLIQMHELLAYLNENNVLSLIVMAQHGLVGSAMASPIDVTYLADTVLLLRFFEVAGQVRQAIAVIKKRTGPHERTIRQFELSGHGVVIGEPLSNFQGILTGVPDFLGSGTDLVPAGYRDAGR